MKKEITFTMIKPFAVERQHVGQIIEAILEHGFRISALKMLKLTKIEAEAFYEIHRGRPFFDDLVQFMSSGPIVAAILEKDNAVEDYRKLIGNTDPSKAESGTIRHMFGSSIQKNAVHGSDSPENAIIESGFFFNQLERF
ncbi:MAG: nucleoside-diphosphate kinase [Bacteroidales bacterium]|nr:nucleoside-diphosphate kinase [Bacteroidales bacterium]